MSVSAIGNGPQAAALPQGPTQELGKDEFMRLLVAQMSYQDPLEPLSGTEFVAQLAQFSGVEQLVQVNRRLDLLELGQAAIANAQTAALIGKEVTARADTLPILAGEAAPPVQFELAAAAEEVTVTVTDSTGRVVRTIEAGSRGAGPHAVEWDGLDQNGAPLPPGTYRVSVSARDADGAAIAATSRISGTVTGVTFEQGYPEILIGDVRVRLGEVLSISDGGSGT